MAEFLSAQWFQSLGERLAAADPPLAPGATTLRVVFEFADAPSSGPHAMTFALGDDGASVAPGDHLAADAIVRLAYGDARAISGGETDSATALRGGLVKVRGDVNAVVPLLAWLLDAYSGEPD